MKLGMFEDETYQKTVLNWSQVAAFRLFFASLVILPFGVKAYRAIPAAKRGYAVFAGILGSFLPAFCFTYAETKLNGGFVGMLNSLTPVFVILVGVALFTLKPTNRQILGILISLSGSVALFFAKSGQTGDLKYVGFALFATVCYGFNVNMVNKKLAGVSSMHIAALSFSSLLVPSAIVLLATGSHQVDYSNVVKLKSLLASALLGVLGTTVASVLFYILMKKAGAVFASGVTYGIPFIALGWDIFHGHTPNIGVWLSLIVILSGILVLNTKK
jgi:drug/metabolite transporter (DMT)-like permease